MIDWYFILFIAFALLIIHIEKIGEHQSVHQYMMFNREVGLSDGSYALLIQFITGGTIFLPIFITEQFKLSSLFIFVISAWGVYFLLVKVTENQEIRKMVALPLHKQEEGALTDLKPYFLIIFAISNLGAFFIQISLLGFLFDQVFQLSLMIGIPLFLSFCFIYFGLGGSYGLRHVGSKLFFIIYLLTVFISLMIYMRTGIEPVFKRFNQNFVGIFDGPFEDVILITFTFIFTIFGQTCTNFYFWQSIHSVKSNHRLSVLRLSVFAWSALTLAFIAFTIFLLAAFSNGGFFSMLHAIRHLDGIILSLFTTLSLAALMLGVGTALYSLNSIYLYVSSKRKQNQSPFHVLRQVYLFGLIICIFIGLLAILSYQKMGEWIPFFIAFYSSVGIPFLRSNITARFHSRRYFYTTVFMIVVSIFLANWMTNIWLIAPASVFITLFIWIVLTKLKII